MFPVSLTVNEAHKILQDLERDNPEQYHALRDYAAARLYEWRHHTPFGSDISHEVILIVRFEPWQELIHV